MFKIKFDVKEKQKIKQALGIQEGEPYTIVLCEKPEDAEDGMINLVFKMENLSQIESQIQFFQKVERITLQGKTDDGEVKVSLDDIMYIESFGNDIYAYTKEETILLPNKLYQLVEELAPFGFFRISKSCIVNVGQIYAIKPHINGKLTITMTNKQVVEVNRTYVQAFKTYLKD